MMLMRCLPIFVRTADCHSDLLASCPETLNFARSKSACVRRGASSEVPGITVEEVCFIAFCLSHGNDADGVVGFDMNNQHNQRFKQANADHALFAIIFASILEQHHGPGKRSEE